MQNNIELIRDAMVLLVVVLVHHIRDDCIVCRCGAKISKAQRHIFITYLWNFGEHVFSEVANRTEERQSR